MCTTVITPLTPAIATAGCPCPSCEPYRLLRMQLVWPRAFGTPMRAPARLTVQLRWCAWRQSTGLPACQGALPIGCCLHRLVCRVVHYAMWHRGCACSGLCALASVYLVLLASNIATVSFQLD
jgi:hypothetical protein